MKELYFSDLILQGVTKRQRYINYYISTSAKHKVSMNAKYTIERKGRLKELSVTTWIRSETEIVVRIYSYLNKILTLTVYSPANAAST